MFGWISCFNSDKYKNQHLHPKPTITTNSLNKNERLLLKLCIKIYKLLKHNYVNQEKIRYKKVIKSILRTLNKKEIITFYNKHKIFIISIFNHSTIQLKLFIDKIDYLNFLYILLKLITFLDHNFSHLTNPPLLIGQNYSKGAYLVIESILEGLDPYSHLLLKEEFQDLKSDIDKQFGGVGLSVLAENQVMKVVKLTKNGSAKSSGIRINDIIIKIDGLSTFGRNFDELVSKIRGKNGTTVMLTLLSPDAWKPRDILLTREIIQTQSVYSDQIKHRGHSPILYTKIKSFSSETSQEIKVILKKHRKKYGKIPGLILDLRDCPGGLFDEAIAVSDLFLSSGKIVQMIGETNTIEFATNEEDFLNFPIIVLINQYSASASEIVAGALQDQKRAIIVGRPSFGKSSVQRIFDLPQEQGIKITIAKYHTPKGKNIQNVGIKPDIWLQFVATHYRQNWNLLDLFYNKNHFYMQKTFLNETKNFPKNLYKYFLPYRSTYEGYQTRDITKTFAERLLQTVLKNKNNWLRSNHWLHFGMLSLGKELRKIEKNEVLDVLKQKFQVDFTQTVMHKNIDLSIHVLGKTTFIAQDGSIIPIKFSLDHNQQHLSQVSVLAIAEYPQDIPSQEVLIGHLDSNYQGIFTLKLPSFLKKHIHRIRFAATISGKIIAHSQPIKIRSINKKRPVLTTSYRFIEGNLKTHKFGKIRLQLKNHGQIAAKNIRLKFLNLSGKEFSIENPEQFISHLPSQKNKILTFSLKRNKVLGSKNFSIGLSIYCKQLIISPITQRISIPIQKVGSTHLSH